MKYPVCLFLLVFVISTTNTAQVPFKEELTTPKKPWTDKVFKNDPEEFQFAIVTDRTGGHREGIFGKAVEKLNLLQPEFVMCVGDLIEGYTKDSLEVNRQWDEFNTILSDLEMRFFYLPGNHDISNQMMRNQWLDRYGRSYYHFRYGDVLFLAFDSNDGDGVLFSEEQINYFKQVIEDNADVRWTLLFMHHPIWNYRDFNGFKAIEEALKDRPYTVYAGHNHRYLQTVRQERNYYILATTGGGSQLTGPKFGQYDHITWITMTDKGPKMINLQLEGLLNHDISNDETRAMANSLMEAADFKCVLLNGSSTTTEFTKGKAFLNINNTSDAPLFFKGRFYHHHQLNHNRGTIELEIAPGATKQIEIDIETIKGSVSHADVDPLELDWVMGYQTEKLETPFELNGTFPIPLDFTAKHLEATEMDIFLDNHQIALSHPFQDLILKYTLDGSAPSSTSITYEAPIAINATTTLKARLFSKDGKAQSEIMTQTYRKVSPWEAERKIKKEKPGLTYQYFEGNFLVLPDFKTMSPQKTGVAEDFLVEEIAERQDHFAVAYEGYIEVPATGIYTFYTYSDDGSKLYLHDQLVVNNDGSHSARLRKGAVALEAGKHPITIEYFEDFLGETLRVGYLAPGAEEMVPVDFTQFSHSQK